MRKPEPGRSIKGSNVASLGAGSSSRNGFKLNPRKNGNTGNSPTAMDGLKGGTFLTGARCEVYKNTIKCPWPTHSIATLNLKQNVMCTVMRNLRREIKTGTCEVDGLSRNFVTYAPIKTWCAVSMT